MRRLWMATVFLWASRALADKGDISQLLTSEAPFTAPAANTTAVGDLVRLELTTDIVKACKPDLSDLRVFDGHERELPFLVYSFEDGVTAPAHLDTSVVVQPRAITRSESAQASGPPLRVESYDLPLSAGGPWMLQIEIDGEFVAHVDIDAKAGKTLEPLVKGASIFRLPEHSRDVVDLPRAANFLRVKLTSQSSGYLQPRFRLLKTESYARRSVTVPLQIVSRRQERHKTILEVWRPGALMPLDIHIGTTTPLFDRPVKVFAVEGENESHVSDARIFRVHALGDVESLAVPIGRQSAERLRIEIDDQDSPPLDDIAVDAVIANPILVFARTDHGTVRFGGGRAYAPRYDVANMAELKELFDPTRREPVYRLPVATLGAPRANPRFNPAPLLGYAMRAGAAVDTHLYRHRRTLTVAPSTDGLSLFYLGPDDLAVLQPGVPDVRIVDANQRQWPYVVTLNARQSWQRLLASAPTTKSSASSYDLKLPVVPFTADRIRVDPAERFFDRAYSLWATSVDGSDRQVVASGRLVRHDASAAIGADANDAENGALDIPMSALRTNALTLSIVDGENAPLTFDHADAHLNEPAIYLVAPAGTYSLLMGNVDDHGPTYDIASVRDQIVAVAAQPVQAGALERNPDFRVMAQLSGQNRKEELFLWLALGIAVVVLGSFTLRMARRESA